MANQSSTRKQLRQEIDRLMALVPGAEARSFTHGSSCGTSFLYCTAFDEPDDYWNNYWAFILTTTDAAAPQGEERRITDYSFSYKTVYVAPDWSAIMTEGDTFEFRRSFSAAQIHSAINGAVEQAIVQFPEHQVNEGVVLCNDQTVYSLASEIGHIMRVELLTHPVLWNGEASDGDDAEITQANAGWTTNQFAGYEVAVFSGTGKGQYRTIESNDADTLTVSVEWTTNPVDGDKFLIKDATVAPSVYRVMDVMHQSDSLYYNELVAPGQRLRIWYEPVFSPLAADADVTYVPRYYVARKAAADLLNRKPELMPEGSPAHGEFDRWQMELEFYLRRVQPTRMSGTVWGRSEPTKWRWS